VDPSTIADERSDESLLAAVLAGEMEALAELVRRYQQPVANYLARLAGSDWALAQDLAQETFLRVLRTNATRGHRPFKPWLYTIATNLARDHFKSSTTRREVRLEPEHGMTFLDATPGPEEAALRLEEAAALRCALDTLGEEYRVTLLLRFFADLSLQDIAVALGIPIGTVKSRLSVGLRQLRAALRSAEIEDQVTVVNSRPERAECRWTVPRTSR
jgi:RNA polymerase sigma-70 factor (ECF subfamily)